MPLRPRIADAAVAVLAAACLVAGAVVIGVARVVLDRYLYISELGALTMPTAELFQVGFLLVAAGIVLVGVVVRDVRTRLPVLRRWAPAASLVTAGGLFLVAAAVPCSLGCPSLLTDGAQWRDWVHIAAAVLAFAAGCVAMLQFATAGDRWVARLSAVSGIAVGVISATGGIISLARGNTDIGSTLEYVAAGLGVVWMLAMVIVHTVPTRAGRPVAPADALVDAER
ncbi:protein-S-isoprenylcysteine O-methyltransferase Ste14 [Agrococcus sp. UYP33]